MKKLAPKPASWSRSMQTLLALTSSVPRGPKSATDWFDVTKTFVAPKETYPIFDPFSKEEYGRRFKGMNDVKFSEKKSQEAWHREGGIYEGQWIEPEFYTSQNLAPWCYEPDWTNEKRFKRMQSRNKRLKEKKEAEQKKLDAERRFRTLRLRTADEFRRSNYVGNPTDEQGTLNEILYKYLKKIDMSLPDGRNAQ